MKSEKLKVKSKKLSKEEVVKQLKKVMDPELGVNIVDLGLIYDVIIKNDNVKIKMTLTSMGCPMSPYFLENVEKAAKKIKGVKKVSVGLVFEPVWSPERISKTARCKLGF